MKRIKIHFLILFFSVSRIVIASPCYLAVAGDSIAGIPPTCYLLATQDAVAEGGEVKVTIRPHGLVTGSILEGKKFGVQGGTLALRVKASRIIVGYVEGPQGFSMCFTRVAVIQNQDRSRRENFLRISHSSLEKLEKKVLVLPENSVCLLGTSSCLVRVAGELAALVASADVVGWNCNGRSVPARKVGRASVTSFEIRDDVSCEPVFDPQTL